MFLIHTSVIKKGCSSVRIKYLFMWAKKPQPVRVVNVQAASVFNEKFQKYSKREPIFESCCKLRF